MCSLFVLLNCSYFNKFFLVNAVVLYPSGDLALISDLLIWFSWVECVKSTDSLKHVESCVSTLLKPDLGNIPF